MGSWSFTAQPNLHLYLVFLLLKLTLTIFGEDMKTFGIITCVLMLALSQQVVYAQQAPTEDFVKLEMPLEEALHQNYFYCYVVKRRWK